MQMDMNDIAKGDQLPPELQDLIDEMKEAKNAKIESIGKEVARRRDEAVKGRKQSGIEQIWEDDEEYYQGIDDANRDTHPWLKSASTSGGISRSPSQQTTRCSSFFNITRQFVESASARMGDILLPSGDWNFAIKATPVQDDDVQQDQGLMPQAQPPVGGMAQPAPPALPADQGAQQGAMPAPPAPEPVDAKEELQNAAVAKAEKAELKIRDWLTECSYHTEVRKVIEDAAKLGTGVLKGPVPVKVQNKKAVTGPDGQTGLEMIEVTSPSSKHVDVWDFFPDPACGEDIHQGNYVLERDRLTARQIKQLKGVPGYLADQIDKVLEEGPNKKNYTDDQRNQEENTKDDDKYEVWYYHGLIDVAGLSAMNVHIEENDAKQKLLPAVVTLVNDTPIKAHLNPLETGEYPYDLMPWQRVAGSPWGIGVARQGRTPQDMLNAAARALMDNAGLSSGPMLILRQNAIRPADGKWEMTARKVWIATEQADIRSVADAILAINIPMVQQELQAIIQLAYKMMEDATGIFFIMQGQQGSAPDTVGGMELLHRNASAILRRLARTYDERVTEPHIRRYYDWLMLYGPEDCKGDLKIEAVGSTALVEREIQTMESMQLLQFALNPAFGLDPEKAMEQVLLSKRYIPEKWTLDEAKKKEQAQQAPPPVPAIEAAKIRAATEEKKMALEKDIAMAANAAAAEKVRIDTDRDRVYSEELAQRNKDNVNIRTQELQIKRDLAMLDYANKRDITLDKVKADLAKESMRLRTQKELAGVARQLNKEGLEPDIPVSTPQVAPTDMEPVGRADTGRAFEQ